MKCLRFSWVLLLLATSHTLANPPLLPCIQSLLTYTTTPPHLWRQTWRDRRFQILRKDVTDQWGTRTRVSVGPRAHGFFTFAQTVLDNPVFFKKLGFSAQKLHSGFLELSFPHLEGLNSRIRELQERNDPDSPRFAFYSAEGIVEPIEFVRQWTEYRFPLFVGEFSNDPDSMYFHELTIHSLALLSLSRIGQPVAAQSISSSVQRARFFVDAWDGRYGVYSSSLRQQLQEDLLVWSRIIDTETSVLHRNVLRKGHPPIDSSVVLDGLRSLMEGDVNTALAYAFELSRDQPHPIFEQLEKEFGEEIVRLRSFYFLNVDRRYNLQEWERLKAALPESFALDGQPSSYQNSAQSSSVFK